MLQIGRQQVTGYSTDWLRDTILRGAAAAEGCEINDTVDFTFTDDLMAGIDHYLEHTCALRILSIEALHARICKMLSKVGFQNIADSLPLLAPPIQLSLKKIAQEAGNGFELAFFNHLHAEIEDLRSHGAEKLHFSDTIQCVKTLRNTKRWTNSCETLHQEILSFLETHGQTIVTDPREIQMNLHALTKAA